MSGTAPPTDSVPSYWRAPFAVGGVLLLAVVAGVLLAVVLTRQPGGTSAGDPTPTPTPTVTESPDPSPSDAPASAPPSETPTSGEPTPSDEPGPGQVVTAPDGVLPPGGIVRVTVDSLRVRQEPSTDAEQVGTVSRGELVVLGASYLASGFGPIEAGGYTWYPVSPLGQTELPDPTQPLRSAVGGWAAIADGTDTWVELLPARCQDGDPDLALIQSLTEWERLACYGDRSITLEGVLGCGGCGGLYPGTFEPSWLATPMNYEFLSTDPQDRVGPFRLRFSPDGPDRPQEPGVAPIVRVTGHFDDPAAQDCVVAPQTNGNEPIEPDVAQLYCRGEFVVESYEVLGTDEDFPFG